MDQLTKKRKKNIEIRIDKDGNLVAWNTPEYEKLKEKLGEEDDGRKIILGPSDLCG